MAQRSACHQPRDAANVTDCRQINSGGQLQGGEAGRGRRPTIAFWAFQHLSVRWLVLNWKTYSLAGNLKKRKGQKLSKGRGAWPTILSILDFYAKGEQDARLKNRYRKLW